MRTPQQAGEFFSFWRKTAPTLLRKSVFTNFQSACLLPWMKQSGGLLWQPLAKNKEVTSHSPRHRDRQLGRSAAARGLRIFPEVVWEGVTRDDFTRPPACPLSSFFFLARSLGTYQRWSGHRQVETSLQLSDLRLWVTGRAEAGDWGGGGGWRRDRTGLSQQ